MADASAPAFVVEGSVPRRLAQPASLQDAFRVVAAGLLCAHFLARVRFTAPLVGVEVVGHSSSASVFLGLSAALFRMHAFHLRVWFVLGSALSALVVVGLALRLFAVLLFCFSAITYQALFPAVTPDDVLAVALPLWLVLLPVGRRMVVAGRRDWKSWLLDEVNGWPWLCCVLFFFAVLGRLCLTTGDSAASLGLFVAAAWAVAPVGLWRGLASVPAAWCAWQLTRFEGAALACLLSLAVCALVLLRTFVPVARERTAGRVSRFNLPTAIGFCLTTLFVLHAAAPVCRLPALERAAGAVLSTCGLAPDWGTPTASNPLSVAFASEGGQVVQPAEIDADSERLEGMLGVLVRPSAATERLRAGLTRELVERHCRGSEEGDEGTEVAPGSVLVLPKGRQPLRVASFRCGADGREATIAMRTSL